MNKFKTFIVGLADSYKAKEKKRTETLVLEANQVYQYMMKMRNDIVRVVMSEIQTIANNKDLSRCTIKPGTKAVLNIYCIGPTPINGWDGGPFSLSSNVPEKDKPVVVTVVGLRANVSYARDLVEKWADNLTENEMTLMTATHREVEKYRNYRAINAKGHQLGDEFGIYVDVDFETESSFKPQWGLNERCFLPIDSIEGAATLTIWKREIELKEQLRAAKQKLEDLEIEKASIVSKHLDELGLVQEFNNQ